MSAPAPPPPVAVDDYYDDDFWEAAVLEIDEACARASGSSAPAPAPALASVQHPRPPRSPEPSAPAPCHRPPPAAGGAGRQLKMDIFLDRRQMDKGTAPAASPAAVVEGAVRPGGGGHPGVRAGEGCSRQGNEDIFMESFTRRRQEKERAAPDVAAARAARGRPGKGRSRQVVEEVEYEPCAVAVDHEAMQTFVYPTNIEVRKYQQELVHKALFTNILVALPTGLGKTFIAAVVMYNYFRWFPEGKIVFAAPSRPLVTQQIEACHNTVGIPQEWAIEMKGTDSPSKRAVFWKSKRVFFVTPQVLENDIRSGICMVKQIVCLVIDEAHRASGNYAYCNAVRELVAARVPLRILALTATPGSQHAKVQSVINNLCISELIHYDENDPKVRQYVKERKVDVEKVPFERDATQVSDMLMDIMRPHFSRLRDARVIDQRDPTNWTTHELMSRKNDFSRAPPRNMSETDRMHIEKSFAALYSLVHMLGLLLSHGINQAHLYLEEKLNKGSFSLACKNELFWQVREKLKLVSCQGPCPKIQKLKGILDGHFNKNASKNSRVIIFSHYRESVKEILCSLQMIGNRLIKPAEFIGQSSGANQSKGQSQKEQQAILQKFRSGEHNVLVATSIGEEGLDIVEVDLVICFDANVSPLRMIQRMGRTGRKHEGQVVILVYEGVELKKYLIKQEKTKSMGKMLHNRASFDYPASPRMVPHVYTPEVKYVKLTIDKYIPCSKKMKVAVKGVSPVQRKISEKDGQLIARYFRDCKEDVWRPSLVAFPRFQLSPCVVHKVPHSFRTTDMLIDAMQQLQDMPFYRTEFESPLQEPANVAAVKCQAREGLYAVDGNKEALPQERDYVKASSEEKVWNQSILVPSSPVKTYPVHSFFGGDYVTVDNGGNVSITFVPVLPQTSSFHRNRKNADWFHGVRKKAIPSKSAADVSKTTVGFDCPAYVTDSGKQMFLDNVSSLAPHYPECNGEDDNADDCLLTTPPSKTLTSPRGKWDTPCDPNLANSTFSGEEDMELSPRLTHYIEEGIVPESPVPNISQLQIERDGPVNIGSVPKFSSSTSFGEGSNTKALECDKGPLSDEKNDRQLSGNTEFVCSSRQDFLDQTKNKTEEPVCPSNEKICTPTTPTNLLCDSFSNDCKLRSVGDTSRSVQQPRKYRRLCKYGDKTKRVSTICLDDYHDEFQESGMAAETIPNQMERTMGKRGKGRRRLDTYIDEEVEVSEDVDVSEDEDVDQSESKYEDSFIDDQETPTGEFTQTVQSENNGDMMGFYRQSLLTQSTVVLPSRYLDTSDNSVSRTGNTSSSEAGHNSTETPRGLPQTHHAIDPSPLWYQQRSTERTSFVHEQTEPTVGNCESSTKLDRRKRKLSFQQPASIPVINLEPEPAPQPSSHLDTGVDDMYFDDGFFENLDLDALEAQATEQLRQKTAQSTEKPVETKKASEISFAPPSFDLGF